MAFNGSGTYVPISPPDFPAVAGTTIRAAQYNNQVNDFAAALSQVICKDGQTNPTANLPMAGFRHSGVGAATTRTQYARAAEVQDGTLTWLTSVSGADTITALGALSVSAYAAGQRFAFKAVGANTEAVTLNINSIGAKAVVARDGSALVANELASGGVYEVVYDGTNFQLLAKNWGIQLATKADVTSATGSVKVPAGTTAQRDGTPAVGYFRFNTTLGFPEYWNGSAWVVVQPSQPSGTVIYVAMNAPPTGYLECNGAAVSRTTYAALFAAIGTVFGVGDGSTTFNLPDLRGEFIRGWDHGRGVDSGRAFGSAQADELKSHTHTGYVGTTAGGAVGGGNAVPTGTINSTTGATGGAETRPRNVALLPCIKT